MPPLGRVESQDGAGLSIRSNVEADASSAIGAARQRSARHGVAVELGLHGHGPVRLGEGEHGGGLGSGAEQPDRSGIGTSSGAEQGRLDVEAVPLAGAVDECCLASAKTTGSVPWFRRVRSSRQA